MIQDTGYRIQDTGYRIQDKDKDTGYRIEYRIQDTGYWYREIQERGEWRAWMKEERDNTWREGGLPTLPGLHLSTFQPSQRRFFRVHTSL
jgi:hypothetical protein